MTSGNEKVGDQAFELGDHVGGTYKAVTGWLKHINRVVDIRFCLSMDISRKTHARSRKRQAMLPGPVGKFKRLKVRIQVMGDCRSSF